MEACIFCWCLCSVFILQIQPLFMKAEAKNKLLRSVAGGGVDSLSSLQAFWDKFELMMESHQLMVKEQVSENEKSRPKNCVKIFFKCIIL